MKASRRRFLRTAAGLFVPVMPALILPAEAQWSGCESGFCNPSTGGGTPPETTPTWSKVQSKSDTSNSGAGPFNLSFASPVTSGNVVVGGMLLQNTAAEVISIVDDKGNVYDLTGQDGAQESGVSLGCVGFKSRGGLTNGPQTLTITLTASTGLLWYLADEFTAGFALPATCCLDGSSATVDRASGSMGSFRALRSNDLLYAVIFSTASSTAGSGWTATQGSGSQQMAIWQQSTTPGLYTPAVTTSGTVWSQTMAVHQSDIPHAWRLRQQKTQRTAVSIGAGGTASITFNQAMASGSVGLGVIAVGTAGSADNDMANLTSLIDDKGNNWAALTPNLGGRSFIWSGATPLTNGPITLTATVSHTESVLWFMLNEFVPPSGAVSVAAELSTGVEATVGSPPHTIGPITPSKNNALLYAFLDHGTDAGYPTDGFWPLACQKTTWIDGWNQQLTAASISAQWTSSGSGGDYEQGIMALTYS